MVRPRGRRRRGAFAAGAAFPVDGVAATVTSGGAVSVIGLETSVIGGTLTRQSFGNPRCDRLSHADHLVTWQGDRGSWQEGTSLAALPSRRLQRRAVATSRGGAHVTLVRHRH